MKPKRFSHFFISRERTVAFLLIGLLFCLLVAMILVVSFSTQEKEELLMKSEAERAFNSIYMALTEDSATEKAASIMKEEGVIGIGIYSSNGRLFRWLGTVPYLLPYENFNIEAATAAEASYGLYSFDKKTEVLQYMRMARLAIDLDAGGLVIDETGAIKTNLNFPDILYVVMDGSSYAKAISRIWLLTLIVILAVIVMFMFFIRLYINNRRYREMLARQESLVSLGAAARTLAHEIKNPLSAMTIQIALLKKMLPSGYAEELSVVDQEIARLTQLTNKVSDFLKNPVGNPELIEVRSFMEGIIGLFSCHISFTPDSMEAAYIEFDPDRARSVFENLIKNAVESCSDRDPQVSIEILERKRGLVAISILDRGDGLAGNGSRSVDMNKYFDPFFTTKIHGSGIGLSISRQFVKARGGSITLTMREGGGTRAEVVLKLVPEKFVRVILNTESESGRVNR